jgi:hypothetical protein
MSKVKMTISVPREMAEYLRASPNASAVVAEAVEVYRAQKLEERLAAAYQEDAAESEALNRAWEPADAEVEE